jgi:protein arginine N-methyltransferase 1
VRLGAAGAVEALVGGTAADCGPRGLAILEAFARPTPLQDGLKQLGAHARGAQDWIELTHRVDALFEAGVLVDAASPQSVRLTRTGSFDLASVHARMLDDRTRTAALIEGIRETVRPGDVVVEIGTGTGVLATAAARAGASRVYAIEVGDIAQKARAVFAANGLADVVTVVEGWSTQVELPELGDVLISEILGDDVLEEHVVELTLDARRRLLKPDARHLSHRLSVSAVPVAIPESDLEGWVFTERNTTRWKTWYEIDFSPLRTGELDYFRVHPAIAGGWEALSEPVVVADLNLETVETFDVSGTTAGTAGLSGLVNGVYLYFEAHVGKSGLLSNRPGFEEHPSWRVPVWRFGAPVEVAAGQDFHITYQRGGLGRHDLVRLASD